MCSNSTCRAARSSTPATVCCRCSPTCCRRSGDGRVDPRQRAPYEAKLDEKLAVTEGLLYRRGNFNGSFDQLILDALMAEKDAQIAFSPGFRWGTSLLPGQAITLEHVMDQTAITYPYVTSAR